jgi:hypothetical protein
MAESNVGQWVFDNLAFADGTAQPTAADAAGSALSAQMAAQANSEVFTTAALVAYAPLASPAFTGAPTVNGSPLGGGFNLQFAKVAVGSIASATPSAVITVTLPVPYADTNYQVQGSVLVAETPGVGAATETVLIGMTQILTNQTFCFSVMNQSSGVHNVTACFTTYHA